ncbi:ATP-binding cassette domain-containing protein [Mycetocola spongiae]|uniref:ATP-binding cassette domain-containing protein n=1 Tax=Mycetocola spongiae TaxID=2859226 RepID=UPI001CF356A9|nr:ATP-binding cassette domain-containing protein [Mycetocola spongiae]UCR89176.1 ATP-binding cassette domain-containing protein [Mycetocola spongiae]
MSAETPLVELRDIVKSYGAVKSLRGVNLRLGRGEVLGLVGDNGAGKSTVMKVLAGAEQPDTGQILIGGEKVTFHTPRDAQERRIGMVYQDLALCSTLDVASNFFLGREPRRGPLLDRARMHDVTTSELAQLGVRVKSTYQEISRLSGGQRQSVAIARAVSLNPDVLILDEPTAALAVAEVEQVLRLIRTVADRGVGVILITHRLQDLFRVCDRITVMYEGQSVDDVPIGDLNIESLVGLITRTEPGTRGHSESVVPA